MICNGSQHRGNESKCGEGRNCTKYLNFTYINPEMDLFVSENSFLHTRIYQTALGLPAEEGTMLNQIFC